MNSDNPYLVAGPAIYSFSGGRTSTMMVKRCLDAHGGQLPPDQFVCFANTGKEREPTLRFVHDCSTHWGVEVHWLEFKSDLRSLPPEQRFEEVGYNSASRKGEPFDLLISRKQTVPSPATGRICTERLKVMALFDFAATKGFSGGEYAEVIGLRSDEGHRVGRLKANRKNATRNLRFPLADAGVRKPDVFNFWKEQSFDLQLPRGLGNCDHCPFVADHNRMARARFDPAGTEWWAHHEMQRNARMGYRYSFVEILGLAARSPQLLPDDDADGECGAFCATG